MSTDDTTAAAAKQFDDFIKLEWQDIFRTEVHVKLDSGKRFVPNASSQGVVLLRKTTNAFDVAMKLWNNPDEEPKPNTRDRIVEQAGIEYTWEWFLIDTSRPWADAVPPLVRERIEKDLQRRVESAQQHAQAQTEEAQRADSAEDDVMIADMNARRSAEGKPTLSADQEASVRETRRNRRAAAS
jgi:hypothetical protein